MSDKPNLESLGLIPASEDPEASQDDARQEVESLLIQNLDSLATKMNDILVTLSSFNNRISLLEQYVTFLAKKDPDLGPNLKKIMEETK